ncbi:MAG TPA: hypothetical protein VGN57_16745 [Pirellulaceae bacterium]|jgi:type II secretory pathway pseudopilin PulG|nr:hypothetical protein [Pirellulaceae bacterium]
MNPSGLPLFRARSARRAAIRRAFTLAETLVATAIVATMTAALGSLVYAATGAATHVGAVRQTQHHGRRSTERLTELIRTTYSSRLFPGAVVVTSTSSGQTFSDVLALWLPVGAPSAPTGRPRVSEILFIGPSRTEPGKLMQYRKVSDTTVAPAWNNAAGWTTLANSVMSDASVATEVWTDLLHWAPYGSDKRANVLFAVQATPSSTEWQQYLAGTRTWANVPWSIHGGGSLSGIRTTDVTFELQLKPPTEQGASLKDFDRGVFFGGATFRTVLEK